MTVQTQKILTVSQLTKQIRAVLEENIGEICVVGEISNWRVAQSGHAYFTLKDAESQIDAVCFRDRLQELTFTPKDGIAVLVFGLVTVYPKRGNYQIRVETLVAKGQGELQLRFEQIKKRLEAEGLFEKSRSPKPLPLLPRKIGIVTSPTGAAIRDILRVLEHRQARVHVLLYPARVQGDGAAEEIAQGIRVLDRLGLDVIIVGRGGGSIEDLWAFNEEIVVRAVHEARTPIISAVGHEIDFALSDFAADVRAPTPSAAAMMVVKEQEELIHRLSQLRHRLSATARHRLERAQNLFLRLKQAPVFRYPLAPIQERQQRLDDIQRALCQSLREQIRARRDQFTQWHHTLQKHSPQAALHLWHVRLQEKQNGLLQAVKTLIQRHRFVLRTNSHSLYTTSPSRVLPLLHQRLKTSKGQMYQKILNTLMKKQAGLDNAHARLDALSPLAVLNRGYAIVQKRSDGSVVRAAAELRPNEEVHMRFSVGRALGRIINVEDEMNDAE